MLRLGCLLRGCKLHGFLPDLFSARVSKLRETSVALQLSPLHRTTLTLQAREGKQHEAFAMNCCWSFVASQSRPAQEICTVAYRNIPGVSLTQKVALCAAPLLQEMVKKKVRPRSWPIHQEKCKVTMCSSFAVLQNPLMRCPKFRQKCPSASQVELGNQAD